MRGAVDRMPLLQYRVGGAIPSATSSASTSLQSVNAPRCQCARRASLRRASSYRLVDSTLPQASMTAASAFRRATPCLATQDATSATDDGRRSGALGNPRPCPGQSQFAACADDPHAPGRADPAPSRNLRRYWARFTSPLCFFSSFFLAGFWNYQGIQCTCVLVISALPSARRVWFTSLVSWTQDTTKEWGTPLRERTLDVALRACCVVSHARCRSCPYDAPSRSRRACHLQARWNCRDLYALSPPSSSGACVLVLRRQCSRPRRALLSAHPRRQCLRVHTPPLSPAHCSWCSIESSYSGRL
jgi:hypothetical protein